MSRYRMLLRGVLDTETGETITIENALAWRAYQAWLAEHNNPDPYEPPPVPDPTPEELAALAEQDARATLANQLRANTLIQQLRGRSPAEIDNWIQTNVTDLASAKVVLRILAYVVAFIARERLS